MGLIYGTGTAVPVPVPIYHYLVLQILKDTVKINSKEIIYKIQLVDFKII